MLSSLVINSRVRFDEGAHTYHLLDEAGNEVKQLQGVTGVIKRKLFPSEYANVPEAVLEKAKERGHNVHTACELYDQIGIVTDNCDELNTYVALMKQLPARHIASEYVVSDCEKYASCIDKVYISDSGDIILGDIKTTYSLNVEYVSWQLSVYAYLLERQADVHVGDLYAIWLRGEKGKLEKVQRKTDAEIEWLLYAADNMPRPVNTSTEIRTIEDAELALVEREKTLKRLEAEQKELKERLAALMKEAGIKKYESDYLTLAIKADSTRTSFDATSFKAEHPDLYEQYTKTSTAKGGLLIKLKSL